MSSLSKIEMYRLSWAQRRAPDLLVDAQEGKCSPDTRINALGSKITQGMFWCSLELGSKGERVQRWLLSHRGLAGMPVGLLRTGWALTDPDKCQLQLM